MLDLTSTDRYYDWQRRRFKNAAGEGRVRYRKVATEGHVVPRWRTVRSVSCSHSSSTWLVKFHVTCGDSRQVE